MQNTFSQLGNDSKWFLKKSFFQNRYVALETPSRPPPLIANAILNFHFDYLNPSLSVFPAVRFACLRLFSDILDVLQMGFQQAAIVLGCFRCVAVRSEHKGCPGPVQWWHRCRMWTENLWQRSSNSQHRKDVHPIDIISICMLSLTHCTLCNKEVDSKV